MRLPACQSCLILHLFRERLVLPQINVYDIVPRRSSHLVSFRSSERAVMAEIAYAFQVVRRAQKLFALAAMLIACANAVAQPPNFAPNTPQNYNAPPGVPPNYNLPPNNAMPANGVPTPAAPPTSAPLEGPLAGFAIPASAGPVPGGPIPSALLPGEEMVVDVRIEGAATIAIEKIKEKIRTHAGRPYDSEQISKDVRALYLMNRFVSVTPLKQPMQGGCVVIFRIVERPVFRQVVFVGNNDVRSHTLETEGGLKKGDAADPFAVQNAATKIREYYEREGYARVRVTILEGDKSGALQGRLRD